MTFIKGLLKIKLKNDIKSIIINKRIIDPYEIILQLSQHKIITASTNTDGSHGFTKRRESLWWFNGALPM